jgi:hypothetical protein
LFSAVLKPSALLPMNTDRGKLIAIFCGLTGILVASYTNQVFGQIPTATLVYISIVFLSKPQNQVNHAKHA